MDEPNRSFINSAEPGCHLFLTSPIPPSTNYYLSYRAIIKHGKPMAMSYCTQEAKHYKEWMTKYITDEAKKQNWGLTPNKYQHFYVDADFYFPRVDMDGSNYFKVMLDAITDAKVVWLDDNVVCERVQHIYYDVDNPRIELHIHPVNYIGVFEDAPHLETFVSKCIGCTRYKRNCSILHRAKEGRIQEEIHDGVCKNYKEQKNVD